MTARLCRLDHPDLMPAMRGIDLCPGHREQLEQDLADTDLLIRLTWDMTLPTRGPQNRRGARIDPAAPGNLVAIAATDWRTSEDHGDHLVSVTGVIERWAGVLYRMHPWVTPARPTIGWGLDTINHNLIHLLRYPYAVRFAQDLHDTAHMLRSCAGEILPPIGRHAAPHPRRPDRDCGGRLYPISDTGNYIGIRCIDCGETYDGGSELRRLGLVLETTP